MWCPFLNATLTAVSNQFQFLWRHLFMIVLPPQPVSLKLSSLAAVTTEWFSDHLSLSRWCPSDVWRQASFPPPLWTIMSQRGVTCLHLLILLIFSLYTCFLFSFMHQTVLGRVDLSYRAISLVVLHIFVENHPLFYWFFFSWSIPTHILFKGKALKWLIVLKMWGQRFLSSFPHPCVSAGASAIMLR